MLLGKRQLSDVSGRIVEAVGTGPSDFAKKQLEKYGWTQCVPLSGCLPRDFQAFSRRATDFRPFAVFCRGMGLGKHNHGEVSHLRISKKGDDAGVSVALLCARESRC